MTILFNEIKDGNKWKGDHIVYMNYEKHYEGDKKWCLNMNNMKYQHI